MHKHNVGTKRMTSIVASQGQWWLYLILLSNVFIGKNSSFFSLETISRM